MSTHLPNRSASPASNGSQRSETSGSLDRSGSLPSARLLLRIDGGFEAVLGALLILSPATGLYTALNLPNPASEPVVIVCGLLLLPLFPILWRAARAPQRHFVLALAAANGVAALLFALWVLVENKVFYPAGAAFVLAVAGVLALLAALQARAALDAASSRPARV